MKILICSDIHGDLEAARKTVEAFERHCADKLLILGDILYHGPRNNLPDAYSPKGVIELLNPLAEKIISVRGNCDAEVDDMVLTFPVLIKHRRMSVDGLHLFITHGHRYNTTTPPRLKKGEILLHGHTHVVKFERFGDENVYINPGSVSIPKENTPKSYILYENRCFHAMDFDGNTVFKENV